jgi:hypothetical protein
MSDNDDMNIDEGMYLVLLRLISQFIICQGVVLSAVEVEVSGTQLVSVELHRNPHI